MLGSHIQNDLLAIELNITTNENRLLSIEENKKTLENSAIITIHKNGIVASKLLTDYNHKQCTL